MTNLERFDRGITDSNLCPRCNLQPESIMHVLRDCEGTLELWQQLVDPNMWHLFASLGLERWLEFNLGSASIGQFHWNWPILFGSMVHMIWIDRNHFVFSGQSAFPDLFMPKFLGHLEYLHQILLKPGVSLSAAKHEALICWQPPAVGSFKLNVDGSRRKGFAACGGLVRDSNGSFVRGFYCNLGTATSVSAELWGLVHGLCLAKNLGIQSLLVELDSQVVINMIRMRRTICCYLKPLLDEALQHINDSNWHCSVSHVYREANSCADHLTNLGHQSGFLPTVLAAARSCLALALGM